MSSAQKVKLMANVTSRKKLSSGSWPIPGSNPQANETGIVKASSLARLGLGAFAAEAEGRTRFKIRSTGLLSLDPVRKVSVARMKV